MNLRPRIVVVGSLNVDHTLRVARMPAPGETLTASSALTCFGGKGANQALAAARAGGEVALIGCIGDDHFGAAYLEHLRLAGVVKAAILKAPLPTGAAFIIVDDAGENSIVFNAGANAALQPQHLDACADVIRSAAAMLLQWECPLPTVRHAAGVAAAIGIPVILNPSPLSTEFIQAGLPCDTLIANAHEATTLTGLSLDALQADCRRALSVARCRQLIITRGSEPTLVITAEQTLSIAPPVVTPVDTVGAGDTFAGAFAVVSASGAPLEDAVRFANAAGALATQTAGAQPSIPQRDAILALLSGSAAI